MRTEWIACHLGDVITLKRGYDLPQQSRIDGVVPIVSSSGISGCHNVPKVKGPGVVTGRYGTLGEVFFVPRDFWPLNTTLYVEDFKGNDQRFVAYFLRVLNLADRSGAAAVPGVNRNALHLLPVRKPPVRTQRKIAGILSAYDDLIENNTRRIKILEEMAQALYREWFVHFRFPGHEKVKMVASPIGPIPKGWELKRLDEVSQIVMGQSPKSEFYNERGEGLPFHQGVTNFGAHFPTHRVYCTAENRLAEEGDVLLSVRAPVGRINVANGRIVIGRGLCAVRSRLGHPCLLLFQLKDCFKEEDTMGGGTIFRAVTKDDVHKIELIQPEREFVGAFEGHCAPLMQQLANVTKKNNFLRRTRDLLLPKLISGEIDVSNFDTRM